ncbi:LAFA_0G24696g1_1 [Lachancea sp. 'fantastica']|nr:LAFA_0A00122g1_1 [Lachancea sp. 'fantastica']SCU99539.1 LAFA_0G24696g1_1 [Lachancea sp. 'fantastica']
MYVSYTVKDRFIKMTANKDISKLGICTQLTLVGRNPELQHGFVNPPLYKGSTVIHTTLDGLENKREKFFYGTAGTPSIENLENAWTHLTGAAGTLLSPSGLGSIALVLLSVVKAGDHILISDSVYQPTRHLCDGLLAKFKVTTEYYDPLIGVGIERLIRPNTSLIFLESPGSQTMEVQDVPGIAKVAKKHGVKTALDNTWATPLFFKGHAYGVDIIIEAGTKYVGGHSDLLLGLTSANAESFPALRDTYEALSMLPGAEDCLAALKGLRYLKLRVKEAERKALFLAKWLKSRPEVLKVLHPALEDCPGHEYWARYFEGSTGVFTILLREGYSRKNFEAMLEKTSVFKLGLSWGSYESLLTSVNPVSYRTATVWDHKGYAVRLQVGMEDQDDLQRDLELALDRLSALPKSRL